MLNGTASKNVSFISSQFQPKISHPSKNLVFLSNVFYFLPQIFQPKRLESEIQEQIKKLELSQYKIESPSKNDVVKALNADKFKIVCKLNEANQSISDLTSKQKKVKYENAELSSHALKSAQELSDNKTQIDLLNKEIANLTSVHQQEIENAEKLQGQIKSSALKTKSNK